MEMVDFKQMVFLPEENRYCPVDEVPPGAKTADISGTEVREKYLATRPPASRVVQPAGRGRDPQRDQPAPVPPGTDHLVHRAVRLGQEHRRPRPGRAPGRVRPELLVPGRRRDPHAPVQGPGIQQGRPRHQHPPRRLRGRPGRQPRRHDALLGDQPLPRHPRRGQEDVAGATSSRSTARRRSRSASSATSRGCTPRPAPPWPRASPWASPASTTPTSPR